MGQRAAHVVDVDCTCVYAARVLKTKPGDSSVVKFVQHEQDRDKGRGASELGEGGGGTCTYMYCIFTDISAYAA